MNNTNEHETSEIINDPTTKKSFVSNEDNIKPVFAYLIFTAKYIFKKKSTFLIPIASFILVLLLALFPSFFLTAGDPINQNSTLSDAFISLVTVGIIASSSIFATIKALNLFKDISQEGMEILIVSKPIKRSQIILVRFLSFFLLGIGFSLINFIAVIIGMTISSSVLIDTFVVFDYVLTSL
ncbi:MAG: hypothetical protein ACRCXE_02505, partial [Metamycoplasmataceae bacterium]